MRHLTDLIFVLVLIGTIFVGGYTLSIIPSQAEIYNTIQK